MSNLVFFSKFIFPLEIIKYILSYLEKNTILNFISTNKDFNNLKNEKEFCINFIRVNQKINNFFLIKNCNLLNLTYSKVNIEDINILLFQINKFKFLEHLEFINIKELNDDNIIKLNNLTYLKKLEISNCNNISGKNLINLFPNLKYFNINSTMLNNNFLKSLKDYNKLEILIISNCNITNNSFYEIIHLKIINLQLINCKYITNNILTILKEMSNLKILSLQSCNKINNKCLSLLNFITKLTYINLSGCKILLSEIKQINNTQLKYIDIRNSVLKYNNLRVQNIKNTNLFTVFY